MTRLRFNQAPWTKAHIARDMKVGERGNIIYTAVQWDLEIVNLDGAVYGPGVRTPTNPIWRLTEDMWLIVRPDLEQMIWRENPEGPMKDGSHA